MLIIQLSKKEPARLSAKGAASERKTSSSYH